MKALVAFLVLLVPLGASAQRFEQGPGQIGAERDLAGTVIGIHSNCALVLADTGRKGWEGLGGGGRFFYCGQGLEMGQQIRARGVQVDIRLARIGPRWRPVAVYLPTTK